jgi:hypothetical protein
MSDAAWKAVGEPRAVSWEVWEARGYTPYGVTRDAEGRIVADNRDAVRDAYRAMPRPAQRAFMTRMAGAISPETGKSEGGVLITRYSPPGLGLPPIYAEMRPNKKILIDGEWDDPHRHDSTAPPKPWQRLRYNVYTIWEMRQHIVRHPDHGNLKHDKISDADIDALTIDELRAMNRHGRHRHRAIPRGYVFPPAPTINGVKDKDIDYASRIDVHPWAVPLFEDAEYVFFGIEGQLKSDSMLSHILDKGLPASVFSVPAVWLWQNAKELPAFADRYLQGKTVIVVPDSDWYEKPGVELAATLCRARLEQLGLRACIAAPPQPADGGERLGVDDYLAAGGSLGELVKIGRDLPIAGREQARRHVLYVKDKLGPQHFRDVTGEAIRRERWERGLMVGTALRVLADDDRTYRVSNQTLAIATNSYFNLAKRALADLLEWGLIESDRPLTTERVTHGGVEHEEYIDGKPTLTLLWPYPNVPTPPPQTLQDFLLGGHMLTEVPTDEQLATDAERLMGMVEDIFSIALRWQARFPSSRVLQDTVGRFIAAVQECQN